MAPKSIVYNESMLVNPTWYSHLRISETHQTQQIQEPACNFLSLNFLFWNFLFSRHKTDGYAIKTESLPGFACSAPLSSRSHSVLPFVLGAAVTLTIILVFKYTCLFLHGKHYTGYSLWKSFSYSNNGRKGG